MKPGPKPKYPDSKTEGAPSVNVRMEPSLKAWVHAEGGSTWVRDLLAYLHDHPTEYQRLRELSTPPEPVQDAPAVPVFHFE